MNKSTSLLLSATCGLLLSSALLGQVTESPKATPTPPPQMAPADVAWLDVRAAMFVRTDAPQKVPADPAARRAQQAQLAATFTQAADRAKNFYTKYPDHPKAIEARAMEVQALVSASQAGDATNEGRMNFAVEALRSDAKAPVKLKAQTVAMHAFSVAMRGRKTRAERLAAIEHVARNLVGDYPTEPQGYESLLTVALATEDEAQARRLSDELLRGAASAAVKEGARNLAGRMDLVGKPLDVELTGADAKTATSAVKSGQGTVIYTWASWSPASIDLAAKLKKRGVNANVVALNLDEDKAAAEALAAKESLLGTLVYDERGREGALAQRLKVRSAPQVILVDASGQIRDVRGEVDLDKKLTALGL